MSDFEIFIKNDIQESINVKNAVLTQCTDAIEQCGLLLAKSIKSKGKILFCGNGGSAADCQHLAAELVVRFRSSVNRPAIPAIALTVDPSVMTAGGNDIGFDNVFAREVEAFGNPNDILVGISTSGNSKNVIKAVEQAHKQNMKVIALLGGNGGLIAGITNYKVIVPSKTTARIQESHIMIGHIWCKMIEEILFPEFIN